MRERYLKKTALVIALVAFAFPYFVDLRWKFAIGTVLFFAFLKLALGKSWRKDAGLKIPKRQAWLVLGLTGTLFLISRALIPHLLIGNPIAFVWHEDWVWRASPFLQVLNEEIVLRALLLGFLAKQIRSERAISWGAALLFMLLHWLFYRYNVKGPAFLSPLTLLNLFIFGLVCNSLYLKTRHIGFGFALHAGWNLTRFGGVYYLDKQLVAEGITFNSIEGSLWLTALMAVFYAGVNRKT